MGRLPVGEAAFERFDLTLLDDLQAGSHSPIVQLPGCASSSGKNPLASADSSA